MTTVLLNKREAAERLRVSVRSLDRLRSQGEIRTVRVRGSVRITDAEIERFIAKQTSRSRGQPPTRLNMTGEGRQP